MNEADTVCAVALMWEHRSLLLRDQGYIVGIAAQCATFGFLPELLIEQSRLIETFRSLKTTTRAIHPVDGPQYLSEVWRCNLPTGFTWPWHRYPLANPHERKLPVYRWHKIAEQALKFQRHRAAWPPNTSRTPTGGGDAEPA